jgi:hypothetical protein
MDYICQFFSDPRDIVRIYLATNDIMYKNIAEDQCNCPIINFNEFINIKDNVNVFIYKDIQILYCIDYLYIFDLNENYIKMYVQKQQLTITNLYIDTLEQFNILWNTFNNIFAELYVGDIKLNINTENTNIKWNNNTWITLPVNDFVIYNKEKNIVKMPFIFILAQD